MTATPTITLAQLTAQYQWTPDSDAYRLVRAACAARPDQADADVIVSLARLDRYLASPTDGQFVSSHLLATLERRLSAAPMIVGTPRLPAPPAQAIRLTRSARAWQRDADQNGDRFLALSELQAYYAEGPSGAAPAASRQDHLRITDQRLALIRHQIAMIAGNTDYLAVRPAGTTTPPELDRGYFLSLWDPTLRQPRVVAYTLTQADLATRADVPRPEVERFHADPELLAADRANGSHLSVLPAWYAAAFSPISDAAGNRLHADQGHQSPYNDYSNWQSARETFNMINMSGQSSVLNEQPWRQYEDAVHSLIAGIDGAEANVYVGNLFLCPDGRTQQTEAGIANPDGSIQPGTQLRWYGPGKDRKPGDPGYGQDRFAVPTHCVKVVLVHLPDGRMTAFAIRMRNGWDVPTQAEPDPRHPEIANIHDFLTVESLSSVDEVERLLGVDLALPDGRRLPMEASRTGASAVLPYLRHDLSRADRMAIRRLFPLGAVLPDTLDPLRAPRPVPAPSPVGPPPQASATP